MFGYFLAMVEEGRFFQVDTFPPCYSWAWPWSEGSGWGRLLFLDQEACPATWTWLRITTSVAKHYPRDTCTVVLKLQSREAPDSVVRFGWVANVETKQGKKENDRAGSCALLTVEHQRGVNGGVDSLVAGSLGWVGSNPNFGDGTNPFIV